MQRRDNALQGGSEKVKSVSSRWLCFTFDMMLPVNRFLYSSIQPDGYKRAISHIISQNTVAIVLHYLLEDMLHVKG